MLDVIGPDQIERLPPAVAVRDLYLAAASEPPLNETAQVADVFAALYEATVAQESVHAAAAYEDDSLVAFAYGHPWRWREQRDPWASELEQRLGSAAAMIDDACALILLARHPSTRGTGLGGRTLDAWLAEVGRLGGSGVWLQTTDIDSPARRLYEAAGFREIGHGPNAPNGEPGLVLFRPATARTVD